MSEKKFTRREFLSVLGTAAGAAALAGCAPPPTPEKVVETVVVQETVEVERPVEVEVEKVVTPTPVPDVEGDVLIRYFPEGNPEQYLPPIIEAFNEEYPNINVEYEIMPWRGRRESMVADWAAGTGPDTWLMSGDTIIRWAREEVAEPLEDWLPVEEMAKDFGSTAMALGEYEGQQYGLPIYVVVDDRHCNKKVLDAVGVDPADAPTSWDDLLAIGPELKAKGMYTGMWVTMEYVEWINFVWYAGGNILSEDHTKALLTSQPCVDALTFLTTMYQEGFFPKEGAIGSVEALGQVAIPYFLEGKQLWSDGNKASLIQTVKECCSEAVELCYPGLWHNNKGKTSLTMAGLWGMWTGSENKEATAAWIEFACRPQNNAFICNKAYDVPGSEAAKKFLVTADALTAEFIDMVFPYLEFNRDVAWYFQEGKVTCGPHFQAAVLGEKSVEDALADAQEELQAIINEDLAKHG
jgi:multiple sugar transport system substrate-binding protein